MGPFPSPSVSDDTKQKSKRKTVRTYAFKQHHFMPRRPQGTRHGVNWEPVSVIHAIVRIQLFGGWFPPMMLKACETRREGADYGVDM